MTNPVRADDDRRRFHWADTEPMKLDLRDPFAGYAHMRLRPPAPPRTMTLPVRLTRWQRIWQWLR